MDASDAESPKARLRQLFLALFTPRELRRFIRDFDEALAHRLPGEPASPAALADEAVELLARDGSIDIAFFARIEEERPRRTAAIQACAALWLRPARLPSTQENALRRFRTAIAAALGMVPLVGFPCRGRKPATPLQDVCVPLRLCRAESVVPWTLSRLVRFLRTEREPAARVVVLGAPGSGKSTLCQYLAVVLAGDGQLSGVDTTAVVPLYVRIRDEARAGTDRSFLQHVSERAQALDAGVGVEVLTAACEAGRAVLLVDGLDEVGDPAARTEFRNRLRAFLAVYPRVPALVTSREVGYGEVSLPSEGPEGFLHLDMAPLSGEEMEDFARRWYAAVEPDAGARKRGADDLIASIRAAPAVHALAENRLLITLIALIHRTDARLPGERASLYERCIQMFLDTWPRARKQPFVAVPPGRQRRLVETLAAALVSRRRGPYDELLMARDHLAEVLVSYWRTDDPGAGDIEANVAAWVEFLHEESGLLSELRPGVSQFVHRSLQEYLAACWYERSVADPEGLLLEHSDSAPHREIWLLLVGRFAADRARCDALYGRLVERHAEREEVWRFLLDCLGEEASFSRAAVEAILERTLRIGADGTGPSAAEQAIARLWQFSTRHAATVREWFIRGIQGGRCQALPTLVWAAVAATSVAEVVGWLEARGDRAQAAAVLAASVWPVAKTWDARPELTAIGRWAWTNVDVRGALVALSAMSPSEVCRAAFAALESAIDGPVVAALPVQLALDASALAGATRERRTWQGIGALAVEPGAWRVPIAAPPPLAGVPADMFDRAGSAASGRRWTYSLGVFPPALQDGAVDLPTITSRFDGISLFHYLTAADDPTPEDFWVDALKSYGDGCFSDPDEFGDYFQELPGNDYPLKEFERDCVRELTPGFATRECPDDSAPLRTPEALQEPGPYRLRARLVALRQERLEHPNEPRNVDAELVDVALELHTLHAAHVAIAARSFAGSPGLQASAAVLRQQHAWVLQNWHAVERATPEAASPTELALQLALGWTQYLTTARWPGTPRWRSLLAGPPPSHWWPRAQWHLCWSTASPDDETHRAALVAALDEGTRDSQLGALARSLLGYCVPRGSAPPGGSRRAAALESVR